MTLDEAIKMCEYVFTFSSEEYEQLAEWLEQLKAYKQNTDICPICDTHCPYCGKKIKVVDNDK